MTVYTETRECMACLHTFEPDTLHDLSCPYCSGPSEAVELETRAIVQPDVVTTCPTCDGDRDNGHHDPQYVVPCGQCDGEGTVTADRREAFGSAIFHCDLCGQGMLPDYGMKLGVLSEAEADCPGGVEVPSFCCEDCLSDPENREVVLGVVVTPREKYAPHGADWRA